MKKNMFRSKYLQAVLFIFFLLCFSPQFSYATAPKSVDLIYDMNTQTLFVTINHYTLSAGMHHIKYVEIKKNGMLISINKYGTQPKGSIFTYTYNIPAEKGDVFEVTATCNFWGHKTSTLVVDEEHAALKKTVVANKAEEPAAPKEAVVAAAAPAPEPVVVATAPVVTAKNLAPVDSKQNEIKSIPEEAVRNLVLKWAASWESGDMKTYRGCYASTFRSKKMNLDAWISYKTNVRKNSKNINIHIDNLQISADENIAKAVFTQSYSSSKFKDSGVKTLELRKINDEWKIYSEIM